MIRRADPLGRFSRNCCLILSSAIISNTLHSCKSVPPQTNPRIRGLPCRATQAPVQRTLAHTRSHGASATAASRDRSVILKRHSVEVLLIVRPQSHPPHFVLEPGALLRFPLLPRALAGCRAPLLGRPTLTDRAVLPSRPTVRRSYLLTNQTLAPQLTRTRDPGQAQINPLPILRLPSHQWPRQSSVIQYY